MTVLLAFARDTTLDLSAHASEVLGILVQQLRTKVRGRGLH